MIYFCVFCREFSHLCPEILNVFIANQCNNLKVTDGSFHNGIDVNIIQHAKLCDKGT